MKKIILIFALNFLLIQIFSEKLLCLNSYYYTVTRLDQYGIADQTYPVGITNTNLIAGTSNDHAVIWEYNTITETWNVPERIAPSYSSSMTVCVNNNGKIGFTDFHVFSFGRPNSWSESEGIILLSNDYGTTVGINDLGEIAGHRGGNDPTFWNSSGNPTSLQLYSGNTYSYPFSINDSGIMVGMGYELGSGGSYNIHHIVWMDKSSAPYAIEGLTPANQGSCRTINNNNVIFGNAYDEDDISHCVLWEYEDGSWKLTFDITADLESIGANQKGLHLEDDGLYGFYEDLAGTLHLAKWYKNDSNWIRQDLHYFTNEFDLWTTARFVDINDNGTIVGYGTYDGNLDSFVLTGIPIPIPEPLSIILLCTGLIMIIKKRCSIL